MCNIGLSVSGLRKIRFNAYTPRRISTKNQFPNKPGFPLSTLIILDWYPYVSLFPDLLCKFGLSVSGLRKICFNAYTLRRISTKNQFPKKPGLPLSTLIMLDWYPYIDLFPDFLCNIGLSVSGLRKIRFNAYTLRRIATKYQFPKKPGFLLSAFIILDWSNVDLLFKTERGKIRIMSNKVYLAISKCATITCRDRKKLRKLEYVSPLETILMKVVSHDFPNKSGVHMVLCFLIYCVISV